MNLLNFDDQEKGYEPFIVTKESIKANIGRTICYVDFVDRYRGTYFVRYGIISGVKKSMLLLNDCQNSVDIKKIKQAGIKIEELKTNE